MVKLVGLIRKRPDLSAEAFVRHWLDVHAKLAATLPGLRRYAVNVIDRGAYPAAAYDGFSERRFDSREALDEVLVSSAGAAIADDIPRFIGELTRVVVEEHVIVA